MYIISKIININTTEEVCKHYTHRPIKKYLFIIGEPLRIQYEDGCWFSHEIVENVVSDEYGKLVATTRKLWRFDLA